MDRIEIDVGRQYNGCTFRLHPQSKAIIKKKYPNLHSASSTFISYENQQDFELISESMWRQIAALLIGLSEPQVEEQYEVVLVDPVAGTEIFNSRKQKQHV